MSSSSANECFNVGEIFEVCKDVEALFEEPSVGEEEVELPVIPHALYVFEVGIEVFFDGNGAVRGWRVL